VALWNIIFAVGRFVWRALDWLAAVAIVAILGFLLLGQLMSGAVRRDAGVARAADVLAPLRPSPRSAVRPASFPRIRQTDNGDERHEEGGRSGADRIVAGERKSPPGCENPAAAGSRSPRSPTAQFEN